MTKIVLDNFKGMRPKADDHLLGTEYATFAENTYLLSGALVPYKSRRFIKSLGDLTSKSIFYYRGGTTPQWLEWLDEGVRVVESPITNEIFDRIYFSNASNFQSYTREIDTDVRPKVYADWTNAPTTHPDGSLEGDVILGCPSPRRVPVIEISQLETAPKWTQKWYTLWENSETGAIVQETDVTDEMCENDPGKFYCILRSAFSNSDFLDNPGTTEEERALWNFEVILEGFSDFKEEQDEGRFLGRRYSGAFGKFNRGRNNESDTEKLNIKNASIVTVLEAFLDQQGEIKEAEIKLSYNYKDELADRFSFDRFYTYTFVNLFGEESAPSDPSPLTIVDPTQKASLSDLGSWVGQTVYEIGDVVLDVNQPYECITAHTSGTSIDQAFFKVLRTQVLFKRIYRTVYSEIGVEFKLVAEIPATQNTFVDEVEDKDTSDVLTSTGWDMPPKNMLGLTSIGTFFAGYSNDNNSHTVHFSVENRPHAWPAEFDITLDSKIQGLDKVGNTLVAITEEGPVIFQGYAPSSMQQVRSPIRQSLTNRLAITHGEGAMFWASPDGICMMRPGGGVQVISEDYYLKEEWQDLQPENMKFFLYDRRLMITTDPSVSNLIFDLDERESAFVHFQQDWDIQGGRYNEFEDAWYFIDNGAIWQWNASNKDLTMTWKSKDFRFIQPTQWGCVRVWADDYSKAITFKLYNDETTEVLSIELGRVTSDNDRIVRLPKTPKNKNWSLEIIANTKISKIMLAQSVQDLRGS